jgi:hypothetical protein
VADDRTHIDGPTPIHIRALPAGAQLELDGLRAQIVDDVLDALLDREDTTLWDRLVELANPPEGAGPDDLRLPYEELVEALAERASYRVPLYGRARLLQVAQVLRRIAIRIPGQREGGAAA